MTADKIHRRCITNRASFYFLLLFYSFILLPLPNISAALIYQALSLHVHHVGPQLSVSTFDQPLVQFVRLYKPRQFRYWPDWWLLQIVLKGCLFPSCNYHVDIINRSPTSRFAHQGHAADLSRHLSDHQRWRCHLQQRWTRWLAVEIRPWMASDPNTRHHCTQSVICWRPNGLERSYSQGIPLPCVTFPWYISWAYWRGRNLSVSCSPVLKSDTTFPKWESIAKNILGHFDISNWISLQCWR